MTRRPVGSAAAFELQQVFAAEQHVDFFAEQHPLEAFSAAARIRAALLSQAASRLAAATTYFGGVTPSRFAQASLAVWVMQQQSRQQASASAQPHA